MFKITVEEVKTEEKLVKEWQKLTDDSSDKQYGYVQTRDMVETEATLFYQEVDAIDLVAIIDAVNKKPVKEKKS